MYAAQRILIPEELSRLRSEGRRLRQEIAWTKRSAQKQQERADKQEVIIHELEKEKKQWEEEKEKLLEELKKVKEQRDKYKGMLFKANKKSSTNTSDTADTANTEASTHTHKRGGKLGHKGYGRKGSAVTQTKRVFLPMCPGCGNKLPRSDSFYAHIVEDIPLLAALVKIVTKYEMERQYCSNCKKEVVAKPVEVIPHSKLGINLIIKILVDKYVGRTPLKSICFSLKHMFDITVSPSGLQQILERAKEWFGEDYDKLLEAVRGAPVKHADETSWQVDGINHWLWGIFTKREVCYKVTESRGKAIAKELLGDSKKTDVLVRDDYAGYKKLSLKHQSCWAHLLRVSHEEAEKDGATVEVKELHKRLKDMFGRLKEITRQPFDEQERQGAYQQERKNIQEIIEKRYTAKDALKVQTRIINQKTNLITALLYKDVPLTNNLAEQQIRKPVVIRKISGGSKSANGANIFATNMSIMQTIQLRSEPLQQTLKSYILKATVVNN